MGALAVRSRFFPPGPGKPAAHVGKPEAVKQAEPNQETPPPGARSMLSRVRGATRNESPSRWFPAPIHRLPDRGALRPVLGIRQVLPDGSEGGVPRHPRPSLDGNELSPLPERVSLSQAGGIQNAIRKQVMSARAAQKDRIAVAVPAPPGLAYARANRYVPGLPGGRRGVLRDRVRPGITDVPAQYDRAPGSVVRRVETLRQAVQVTRDLGLRRMYDPPELTLGEATRLTPLINAAIQAGDYNLAASYLPAGTLAGFSKPAPSAQNPGALAYSRLLGTGTAGGSNPPPGGTISPPGGPLPGDTFENVALGVSDYFGSGRGTLGEAVKLTPSIIAYRNQRANTLQDYFGKGYGSLGEAVALTPDILRGSPLDLQTGENNWPALGEIGGSPIPGATVTYTPGSGVVAPGDASGGGGTGGVGGGSSFGLNIGDVPVIAILGIAALFLMRK